MIDLRDIAVKVTSQYGDRNLFGEKFHYGLDLVLKDENVPFVTGGTIKSSGTSVTGGNYVTIDQNDGTTATYYHLKNLPTWKKGDKVNEGDIVGILGNTGTNTTGRHLHYQVRDKNGEYIDPEVYFTLYAENKPFSSYDGSYLGEKHYITDDETSGYTILGNIVKFLAVLFLVIISAYLFLKAFDVDLIEVIL